MKEIKVEVIGPEPPCVRCQTTKKVVEKVVEKLKHEGIAVKMEKANIISRDVIGKYGILVSPAIVVNNTVKIIGRVPGEEEIEKLIKEAAKQVT